MVSQLALGPGELAFAIVTVFAAGLVRGFSGFALSAMIMALLVTLIPPVELIPVCLMLELASSLALMRGGIGDADRRMVAGLQAGSLIGVPIGLAVTTSVAPELSKLVALCLVLGLALLQLARVRLPATAGLAPAAATGLVAGVVTGLASIGGMVIALYTLARDLPPRVMRASMILSIFISGSVSVIWQLAYGLLDATSLWRAAALLIPTLAGVVLGRLLFRPEYERLYRPFCLALLVGLAAVGLIRQLL